MRSTFAPHREPHSPRGKFQLFRPERARANPGARAKGRERDTADSAPKSGVAMGDRSRSLVMMWRALLERQVGLRALVHLMRNDDPLRLRKRLSDQWRRYGARTQNTRPPCRVRQPELTDAPRALAHPAQAQASAAAFVRDPEQLIRCLHRRSPCTAVLDTDQLRQRASTADDRSD
jgi:hypothetical protein